MNDNIDIVVPWVNPHDEYWIKEHNKYSNNAGDNSAQRTRDINIFKYFFRGVELNCPWVNKIHLLLFSESQIPDWLNTENTKLSIHFHKDYIPSELLPTFNTFVIEAFFHKIPGLANNFITCNDDMIWFNKTMDTDYFINNVSVDNDRKSEYLTCNPVHDKLYHGGPYCFFQKILDATTNLEYKITGVKNKYYNYHIPFSLNKNFIQFIWDNNGDLLYNSLKKSKFRREYNFVDWLYRYIKLDSKYFVKSDKINTEYAYFELGDKFNISDFKKLINIKKNICLNDMLTVKTEKTLVPIIQSILNNKFPIKSSFEI